MSNAVRSTVPEVTSALLTIGLTGLALLALEARLWLARAPVVILDEATAEAGSAAAGDLERAALAAIRGRTALIVAHRLSQAEHADIVAVLRDGRLVEIGPHSELAVAGGAYSEIWTAWATSQVAHSS